MPISLGDVLWKVASSAYLLVQARHHDSKIVCVTDTVMLLALLTFFNESISMPTRLISLNFILCCGWTLF